ncbi:MAG: GNAT family N-acetyltransferase [Anaerolineales bacterium]|nr:GNAT family N-acetyltransferase [Anaerolineales bacterium]
MASIPHQPECRLYGRLVEIKPLDYSDLRDLMGWDRFKDPLLQDYNLPFSTIIGGRNWLKSRLEQRWAYAVRNADRILIGHLSLRNIHYPRSSRLGISIGPPYVNQGYGLDTLRTFLDYYFEDVGFKEMKLDVCLANQRAIHLYTKLGFKIISNFWRQAPLNAKAEYGTFIKNNKIRFEEMRLESTDWTANRETLD